MPKFVLFVLLAAELWPLQSWSFVYPYRINEFTPPERRWWKGPKYNTGTGFGGWLFRIHHGSAGPICGASYYAPYIMLTSANCIHEHRYDLDGTVVQPTYTHQPYDVYVDTIHTPPYFTHYGTFQDLAVVRLMETVQGRTTEFIKLCNRTIKDNMQMTSYGWGFDSAGLQTSDTRSFVVPVENIQSCRNKLSKTNIRLSSTTFCVTHPRDPRKCRYDGGAPLTYGTELCGVASYGPLCKYTNQPGIYTDINKMTKFIEDTAYKIKNGLLNRETRGNDRKTRWWYKQYKNKNRKKLKRIIALKKEEYDYQ